MQTKMFQSKNIWVLVQNIMCYDSMIIIDLRLINKNILILNKYSVVSMMFKKALFSM